MRGCEGLRGSAQVFRALHGHTVQQVARLLGTTRPNQVRQLRKRVKRLVTRLSDPRFVFVMHCRHQWPTNRRRVAERCILKGESMRAAADTLGLTLHAVRQQRLRIEAMFEAASHRAMLERRAESAA